LTQPRWTRRVRTGHRVGQKRSCRASSSASERRRPRLAQDLRPAANLQLLLRNALYLFVIPGVAIILACMPTLRRRNDHAEEAARMKSVRIEWGSIASIKGHRMRTAAIIWIVLACLLGLGAWFLLGGTRPENEDQGVYVIQLQEPNGTRYFQDLSPRLKWTDDSAKAKRFGRKDGDMWFTAIQQNLAINHTPPATRQAVKMVAVE
jgi:hypothetical protein